MPQPYEAITKVSDLTTELRTLLSTELGTFQNSTKAIWVEPPIRPTEPVTGLEVVIQRYPRISRHRGGINSQAEQQYYWDVALIQFDRSADGLQKLDSAKLKIQQRFPYCQVVVLPISEDAYPQINFSLYFVAMLNTFV